MMLLNRERFRECEANGGCEFLIVMAILASSQKDGGEEDSAVRVEGDPAADGVTTPPFVTETPKR